MAITNAEAIRFVNEQIRPIAEDMRDLKIRIDAAITTWTRISDLFAAGVDRVSDGRDPRGVSILVANDVTNLVTQMQVYQTQLNKVGVVNVISKPTVRTVGRNP